jgi:hypothetical protein
MIISPLIEESFFWPRGWMAPWKAESETIPLDKDEEEKEKK